MDRTIRRLAALSIATGLAQQAPAADGVMQTWHPWQLDSVLVAWALMQTQRPAPLFESVQRGAEIEPQSAIDTPDSRYRRAGQRTAFEEAVRLHKLQHPCVPRLKEAVRVVELAAWRKPEFPAVETFETQVLAVLPGQPSRGGLEAAFAVINRYCREGSPP